MKRGVFKWKSSRLASALLLGFIPFSLQAQELHSYINGGPSLVGDYDPSLGLLEIKEQKDRNGYVTALAVTAAGLSTDGDGIVHIWSQLKLPATNPPTNYPVSKIHHVNETGNTAVIDAIRSAIASM